MAQGEQDVCLVVMLLASLGVIQKCDCMQKSG